MADECVPCKAIDCGNADDYAIGAVSAPVSTEPCVPCKAIDCDSGGLRLSDDYRLHQLQSELYPLVLPYDLQVPNATIRLPCCGADIERTVDQGMSPGQFRFLLGQMIDECALLSPFCADTGAVSGGSVAVVQLRITCCDNSVVVRQIPTTTPGATVDAILVQMITECSLHSSCSGLTGGYLDVLTSISSVDLAIVNAITNLGIILTGFITNTPTSLENASVLLHTTATNLDNAGTSLENSINNLLNQGGLTGLQIAILNVGLEIGNILHVISDLLDLLGDLAHVMSIGGDISSIIAQLVSLTTSLDNAATDLETAITNLLNAGGVTPRTTLVADLGLVVAQILRVVGDVIGGLNAARDLANAFNSNIPAELLAAATTAINAGNALTTTATELGNRLDDLQTALDAALAAGLVSGTLAAQIQADIDLGNALVAALLCMATALIRMAAVATAQATGAGMAAALAALEAVAVCLEAAIALLIATDDPGAIALADILQDLADALRQLALGLITAEEASLILQRAFLIMLVVLTAFLLRLLRDLEQVWRLLLEDAMTTVTISHRCECDGFLVTRTLSAGLSSSQRNALYAEMIAECAQRCPPGPPGSGYPPLTIGPDGNPNPIQLYASAPVSCTVFCPDGSAFNWTTPRGFYIGFSQVEVNAAAHAAACQQAAFYRICLSTLPSSVCVGSATNLNITTAGGSTGSGNVWALVSGSIPTGLSLVPHGTYLSLTGTPTVAGTFAFTIRVVASNGATNTKSYTVRALQILPATLPAFQVGSSYSQQLTLSGSTGTVTFALTSGTLPVGITLTSAGLLAGIPTSASAFNFTITATEA